MPKRIIYENGIYWVAANKKLSCYVVFKNGVTHAKSDSAYPLTADGLTLAKARCDYLAKRH